MSRTLSANYREQTASTGGESPVYLLEITHSQLDVPIRVVNDNQDLVSNGNTFTAFAFQITIPDDQDKTLPRAQLAIDNVGRELVQWLELSGGGRGAQVRIMQVMRNAPDVIEYDITVDLISVTQNVQQITGQLGYEDLLNTPGLKATYRPENTPGVF
jgi:hypothetical protein